METGLRGIKQGVTGGRGTRNQTANGTANGRAKPKHSLGVQPEPS